MNADGSTGEPHQSDLAASSEGFSDWSPDGSKIVYDMYWSDGPQRIWVINSTGGTPVQITNDYGARHPRWQPVVDPVVEVKDENGDPVKDAEVFQSVTNSSGDPIGGQSLGRTNSRGVVSIPDPKVGELLIAQSVVYTGTTNKGSHGGWAFRVHLTNVEQRNSGLQITHVITDATMLTQTLTIKRDQLSRAEPGRRH